MKETKPKPPRVSKYRQGELAKIPPHIAWTTEVWEPVTGEWVIHRWAQTYDSAIEKVRIHQVAFPGRVWAIYDRLNDVRIPADMLNGQPEQ